MILMAKQLWSENGDIVRLVVLVGDLMSLDLENHARLGCGLDTLSI
jgi:hypothetical protein